MNSLKKLVIHLIFWTFFCPVISGAQTNRNAVIGRYIVTSKRLNGSLVVTQSCSTLGKIDIYSANSYCNECVSETDSTDCNGAFGAAWSLNVCYPIKVFADSTMLDTAGFDPAYFAIGKLHYNDSLYLRIKHCTTSEHYEFFGFKLYSTITRMDELSLPENALLISPNPAADIMFIQSTQQNFINEPVLYDLKGAKVNAEIRHVNSHTYKVDVSNLPNGIYFVFVQTNEGYLKKKLVVLHE